MNNPLTQRRTELGLSQEQSAALAHVTVSGWRAWEQWRAAPTRKRYPDIAAALHWSIDDVASAVSELHQQILRRGAA